MLVRRTHRAGVSTGTRSTAESDSTAQDGEVHDCDGPQGVSTCRAVFAPGARCDRRDMQAQATVAGLAHHVQLPLSLLCRGRQSGPGGGWRWAPGVHGWVVGQEAPDGGAEHRRAANAGVSSGFASRDCHARCAHHGRNSAVMPAQFWVSLQHRWSGGSLCATLPAGFSNRGTPQGIGRLQQGLGRLQRAKRRRSPPAVVQDVVSGLDRIRQAEPAVGGGLRGVAPQSLVARVSAAPRIALA